MQFIDEAKIYVKSGDGGSGCVSFRREANIPRGGPDGGDGGRGGDVVLIASQDINTLVDFRYKQHFKAGKGEHGKGRQRTGAAGDDMHVRIPLGTQVLLEDGETLLWDPQQEGDSFIIARGGKGGAGNIRFKSSINQAPQRAGDGEKGQEFWLWLKLKILSDVGLVGLPNAGKSTFLSVVTRAKPKIADYPFTTLTPQLGVVASDDREFVIADIPGLIEGAHEGHGLGDRFLKHIERCRVLLHLVDGSAADVVASYRTIRTELEKYSDALTAKCEVIALSKCDALSDDDIAAKMHALEGATDARVLTISSVTHDGVAELLRTLIAEL